MNAALQESLIDETNTVETLQDRIRGRIKDPDIGHEAKLTFDILDDLRLDLEGLIVNPAYSLPELSFQARTRYRQISRTVAVIEGQIIPSLVGFDEVDRRLTRLVRELAEQVEWPLGTPAVVANSYDFWVTWPPLNLMRIPARMSREIMSLADMVHEMTHILLLDEGYRATLLGNFESALQAHFEDHQSIADSWQQEWLPEFVCDMMATFVTGTVFGEQHIRMLTEFDSTLFEHGTTHPANEARVRASCAVLLAMGRQDDAKYVADRWQDYLAETGEGPSKSYKFVVPDKMINLLAQQIVDGSRKLGIRSYYLASNKPHDVVGIINTAWKQFHADPRGYKFWQASTLRSLWKHLGVPLPRGRGIPGATPITLIGKGRPTVGVAPDFTDLGNAA